MTASYDREVVLDPQKLGEILRVVHEQVAAALWLSAGMIFAVGAIGCIALGWRRAALLFGLMYSLSLCFVRNGHAQVLGPAGCALAAMGFFWPLKRRTEPPSL